MNKIVFVTFLTLFATSPTWGLVSQPTPIFEGENAFDFRLTREGGVMKPSQNKDSFQTANILISQLIFRSAPKDFWTVFTFD
jgi:hypothetical protein